MIHGISTNAGNPENDAGSKTNVCFEAHSRTRAVQSEGEGIFVGEAESKAMNFPKRLAGEANLASEKRRRTVSI
ncbi:MAG TPA: hypothetical protein VFX22_06175 [Candidatus Kapabacteria bacterium]|nr:hypothetical protein [Candidatus Kapabacteria bacterium]